MTSAPLDCISVNFLMPGTLPSGHFRQFGRAVIHHNEHKIHDLAWSSSYLKQSEAPAESPNIIYEVLLASTARQRGIDPLGNASK